MISTADALDVMTLVAACHHRTAPRIDDREAALAVAQIWSELFNGYNLELGDLRAGVMKRARSQADAPEPAEIIAFARDIRRDRNERESDAERQAREDARDAELDRRALQSITSRTNASTIGRTVGDA